MSKPAGKPPAALASRRQQHMPAAASSTCRQQHLQAAASSTCKPPPAAHAVSSTCKPPPACHPRTFDTHRNERARTARDRLVEERRLLDCLGKVHL